MNEHGKRTGIDCNEVLNAEAVINEALAMPVDKTWHGLLKDTAEATKTNPELGGPATEVVDARIIQQAPEPIKRLRRKKTPKVVKTSAKRVPHIIPILKKLRITKPAPPTAEVRENGQAGSADEPSPARQLIERWEDEADDWEEFVEPPAITISTSQADIDPPKDVIIKDVQT